MPFPQQAPNVSSLWSAFAQRGEVRVSLIYCVVAVMWIVFSDQLLALISGGNSALILQSGLMKGLGFVAVTTLALFAVLSADARKQKAAEHALHRSEQQYRRIIETTYEGVWLADTDNRTTFVNNRMAELLGYSVAEMLGASIFTFVHTDDHEAVLAHIDRLNQGSTEPAEIRLKHKHGAVLWGLVNGNPLFDDSGIHNGTLAMVTDITEHKQAVESRFEAERLMTELKKEKEIVELKDRFTAMVSHEFRSPLSAIVLCAELLESHGDQMTPEKRRSKLEQIRTAASRMTELLEDVLTLNKTRADTPEPGSEPINLEQLYRDLMTQIEGTDKANHRLVLNCAGELDHIRMDGKLVQHIVTNLLSNAVKYSPEGSEVITELSRDGDVVVFSVRDHGIGIPEQDQKRLFEPFHRAKNAHRIAGTGLGLAIVKECVDKAGGTITFASAETQGTTFTVRLPIGAEPVHADQVISQQV